MAYLLSYVHFMLLLFHAMHEWVAVRVFAQIAAGLSDVFATDPKRRQICQAKKPEHIGLSVLLSDAIFHAQLHAAAAGRLTDDQHHSLRCFSMPTIQILFWTCSFSRSASELVLYVHWQMPAIRITSAEAVRWLYDPFAATWRWLSTAKGLADGRVLPQTKAACSTYIVVVVC